ncbi:MAG TPA: YCF48-related protein [Nevskiales bacterium]|nr:YCF48-related protein [Nevskiales bacterium]
MRDRCPYRLVLATLAALALPASAQEKAGGEPPPHSLKPQPALAAPLAAKYRLIDITDTGKRLVAVGQRGNIVVSDDGKTWKQVPSPVNVMLTRARFLDPNRGWAVGYDAAILHSADGGDSWQLQHYDAEARQLYDILMLDAQNGIAVGGYGTYLVTADGGRSWQPRQFPLTDLGLHFNAIERLGDGTLFIAGEKSLMAWSADNGATWTMLDSPYNGSFFGAVPLGTRGVLVYGLRGHTYVSLDVTAAAKQDPATFDPPSRVMVEDPKKVAAMGWRYLAGGLYESMFGATPLPDGEVLLAGVNGLAQRTRLAAGTLEPVRLPTDATLADLFIWRGRLIGVGKRGVVDLGALN